MCNAKKMDELAIYLVNSFPSDNDHYMKKKTMGKK